MVKERIFNGAGGRARGLAAAVAVLLAGSSATAQAGSEYSEWGMDTVILDAPDLDGFGAGCPIETPDGLALYTARTDDSGQLNIWVNEREAIDGSFHPGDPLPEPVNVAAAADFCPTPLRGNGLLFVSDRDGGCGDDAKADIYYARNSPALGWRGLRRLGCDPHGPNTPGLELSPALVTTRGGVSLYYSSDFFTGDQDIYLSRLGRRGFGAGEPVHELNTPHDDRQPNLTQDGLEIVFASDRHDPGSGNFDIYYASRHSTRAPFSEPVNLSRELDFSSKEASETRPSFSWDKERVVWGSGGVIYQIEREKLRSACRFRRFCRD